ncbi:MAG: two-component sensor histidine kinase, partial [Thermoanaerobaculia bacterium]
MPSSTPRDRPDPEAFLKLASRDPKRGNLKVYLGQAAGVGKTYRMLDDAHEMRRRGIDIVAGFVETHGRAETAARIADLEVIPRRLVPYKGAVLEEMDLAAVLARKPEVAVVDELPHTNAPGGKN